MYFWKSQDKTESINSNCLTVYIGTHQGADNSCSELLAEQFAGTPGEAKVAATCTLTTAFQEVGIEPDAVQEVAELGVGCVHDFALTIEVCICMDLDGFVRVDVLEEPFELNGFRQVIVLLGDAADEECF